jgi:hypothetical protein
MPGGVNDLLVVSATRDGFPSIARIQRHFSSMVFDSRRCERSRILDVDSQMLGQLNSLPGRSR